MARKRPSPAADVLVLGTHASAYLAAALLARAGLRVLHAGAAAGSAESGRLELINPALFDLHELLIPLRRRLTMTSLYGLRLLPHRGTSTTRYVSRAAVALAAPAHQLRDELARVAKQEGATLSSVVSAEAVSADEAGVTLSLDGRPVVARMLLLSDQLPANARTVLHLNEVFEPGVLHRYTWCLIKHQRHADSIAKPGLLMSMDLAGQLMLGWLIPGDGLSQLAVAQPIESQRSHEPGSLLRQWMDRLIVDGTLPAGSVVKSAQVHAMTLPFAGALGTEGVGNRTLLIGPAGGFVSSTAEDVYPGCWSAVMAAEVAKKALKETHLQDALDPYRHRWRTTLGEYLRGPEQNLRHLLPLVYRNETMTQRLAEAIFKGTPVVR